MATDTVDTRKTLTAEMISGSLFHDHAEWQEMATQILAK